jgi:hypothetical protein
MPALNEAESIKAELEFHSQNLDDFGQITMGVVRRALDRIKELEGEQVLYLHVDRVEVIDSTGRAFVNYYRTDSGVSVELQDDGRTLKVFAETPLKGQMRAPYSQCGFKHPIKGWVCSREQHEGVRHWFIDENGEKYDWLDTAHH